MTRLVAIVTGASRGIGRATALQLAEAGYDVAVTARTRNDGEGRDDSDVGKGTLELPGSVESTATAVEAAGGRALRIQLDVADRDAIDVAVQRVLSSWGRIDVLVNNAVHLGGTTTRLLDLAPETLERTFLVNAVNPLYLIQRCLPSMLERGGGVVINVSSGASLADPPAPAGEGGWGVSYGMSKAALNRVAGVVHVEYGARGVRAYTVTVGAATERAAITRRLQGLGTPGETTPAEPASALVWLAAGSPEAVALSGQLLHAHELVQQHDLHAEWVPAG
jgi:NAD(P)-dependent dehydrogenase (short-subunit alcohol dehydrogenase family)